MGSLTDRILAPFKRPPGSPPMFADDSRAFIVGGGVVERQDLFYGRDTENFSPPEYGDYLASSSGVYAASRMRATLLSSLPLALYQVDKRGERTEITDGDAFSLFHSVNPYWTFRRLVEMTEYSLCLWGKAFWFIQRTSKRGVPKEIWWARPDHVRVVPHKDDYVSHFLYRPADGGNDIRFEREETFWARYANPLDEYEGFSPLAAARISADMMTDAQRANRAMFTNGMQPGGFVFPDAGGRFTKEQKDSIQSGMNAFRGTANAHRWGVFTEPVQFQTPITPKDAEFLGALAFSLEEICRAYGVPLDLLGGQRTYANVEASERIIWTHTIVPEARFIATEITEQILPMFGRDDIVAEFDTSGVDVLKESENDSWTRQQSQLVAGTITVNEWRADQGLEPVVWGDDWWRPAALVPEGGPMAAEAADAAAALADQMQQLPPALPETTGDEPDEDADEAVVRLFGLTPRTRAATRVMVYGSDEHARHDARVTARAEPHEAAVRTTVERLLRDQRKSVLARLQQPARSAESAGNEPFDRARWTRTFRLAIRPVIASAVDDAARAALDDLSLSISFDLYDPNVIRAMERLAQFFGKEVNQTTWDQLRQTLADGMAAGEGMDALIERVRAAYSVRLRDAEMIARTSVTGASSTGTIESWRQSGVVQGKRWVATLDTRVRPSHREAHGQTVGFDEDFTVGGAKGPGPGLMTGAKENVLCRCSMTAVLDTMEMPERSNGHRTLTDLAALAGVTP